MSRISALFVGSLTTVLLLHVESPHAAGTSATAGEYRQLLDQYCVGCHNQRLRTAGLELDRADLTKVPDGAATWEKVQRKLREGSMPPQGRPHPTKDQSDQFTSWLVQELDESAAAHPVPGRPSIHRLNRTEYVNVVRDVLNLNVDADALLPPDDLAYGFDNIADALSASPTLIDRYVAAADTISRLATGDPTLPGGSSAYSVSTFLWQDERMNEDMPFGSRGGLAVRHRFPLNGTYRFRIRLQQLYDNRIRGLGEPTVIDLLIDSVQVRRFSLDATPPYDAREFNADAGLDIRLPIEAGERTVTVTFPQRHFYREGPQEPMPAMTAFAYNNVVNFEPAIDRLQIDGPFDPARSSDTPSRRAIFICQPHTNADERPCVDRILTRLATRLYRRPARPRDVEALTRAYQVGRAEGTFEDGIRSVLQRALIDPQFLFRLERDPPGAEAGRPYRLSDHDLASRLSFFLWSSGPDDALLDAATRGTLHDPTVLSQQVRRMLADPRSRALVTNFGGQWLWLRNVNAIHPNATLFPEWNDTLRQSLRQETELFLNSMIKEDRVVPELLTANYTFLNDRLAEYYGIRGVYGSHFRRVTVTDPARQGLLGHGSILSVTSYDNRTSPVKRGNWLLENVIGAPSPPPPPNVPSLPESDTNQKPLTMRERMTAHRKNPICASCHTRIDPLGFALERFDGIGKSRTTDGGNTIDTSGTLPNGDMFNDVTELRELLVRPPDRFVETVTEKLLTYAIGRGLEYYDMPAVRKIVRDASANGYHWSSVILGICQSVPFQMRDAAPDVTRRPVKVTRTLSEK